MHAASPLQAITRLAMLWRCTKSFILDGNEGGTAGDGFAEGDSAAGAASGTAASGTCNGCLQPGQVVRAPAFSSGTVKDFWQDGQAKRIMDDLPELGEYFRNMQD
jgi:hypothetical protein